MTASKFMDIQRAIQPDWFQCISDGDTISGEGGRKRAKKSVDRSLSFLDVCLQLLEKSPVRSPKYRGNSTTAAFWSVLHAGPVPGCDLVGNRVTCYVSGYPGDSPGRGISSSTVGFPSAILFTPAPGYLSLLVEENDFLKKFSTSGLRCISFTYLHAIYMGKVGSSHSDWENPSFCSEVP